MISIPDRGCVRWRSMAEQEHEYGVTQAVDPDGLTAEDGGQESQAPRLGLVEEPQAETPDPLAEIKAERDQLLDRLARLQAEFENARKRQERERQEFRDYATGSVVEQFLPVIDNFALALNSKGTAEQLRSGVELIVKQMDETLR